MASEHDPEHRLKEAEQQLKLYHQETDNDEALRALKSVQQLADHGGPGDWLRHVQLRTAEWREETVPGATPLTQAAHTSVEANELLDLLVKDDTYGGTWATEDMELRRELVEEAGDVVIAHLGTLSLLGVDVRDAVDAALEKNGAREWEGWKEGSD
jgi:NTP pyrophosphatase (non-canonical NTP hydrolase)